jgi:hypothetical protein
MRPRGATVVLFLCMQEKVQMRGEAGIEINVHLVNSRVCIKGCNAECTNGGMSTGWTRGGMCMKIKGEIISSASRQYRCETKRRSVQCRQIEHAQHERAHLRRAKGHPSYCIN